jgi:hypothetical protein
MVFLVSEFAFCVYGRQPYEMGCVQWWSGRVWAWLLLVVAIALHAKQPVMYDPEPLMTKVTPSHNQSLPMLRNATALSELPSATALWVARRGFLVASAAMLFVLWLLSHLAFFRLCKREYWQSFLATHSAAAYVRLKWEAAQSDERRAGLLVKLHPAVLRLIAADARLFIEARWRQLPGDRPAWMADRWLRGVPSSMLPKKVPNALCGKHRRKSSLAEQLELLNGKALSQPHPVAHSNGGAVQHESVVANPVSRNERPAPELLAVVPTAGS